MIDSIKLWMRVRAFMAAIHRELREGHSVVILYEVGSSTSGKVFREMRNPAFRERVMKLLDDNPWVVCQRFSPPDSYDDWTFSAYPKPPRIEPGHCRVCNHAHVQDNHCQNVSCRARQKPELADTFIG